MGFKDCECRGRNPNCLKCEGRGYYDARQGLFTISAKSVDKIGTSRGTGKKKFKIQKVFHFDERKSKRHKIKKADKKDSASVPQNLASQKTIKIGDICSMVKRPFRHARAVCTKFGLKKNALNRSSEIPEAIAYLVIEFLKNNSLPEKEKKVDKVPRVENDKSVRTVPTKQKTPRSNSVRAGVRILAAAKILNVGQKTILNYLHSLGFGKDSVKPTTKIDQQLADIINAAFKK